MSASAKSSGPRWRDILACWLPAVLAVGLVLAHIALTMFVTSHDDHDDSGYMLAILRGIAGGGRLYEDVFSQYGPFYSQAWLLFLRTFALPVDHNHAALGVGLLWLFCVGAAAWCVRRVTGSLWWALAAALWCSWALIGLDGELAHPKSLVAALGAAMLAGAASKNPVHAALITGAAAAALTLTKINLGIFALVAVALAYWVRIAPRRWLVLAAGAGSALLLLLLLRHAWPLERRLLLGAAVWIPTMMILQCASATPDGETTPARNAFREAVVFCGSFLLASSLIVLAAWLGGTSLAAQLDGVLLRPLGLRASYSVPPTITAWNVSPALLSLALALLWQFPALRARRQIWRAMLVLCVGAELYCDFGARFPIGLTSPSLLWIAIAPQTGNGPRRWLAFAGLFAVWQLLVVFPVNGSQNTLPRFLTHAVWIAALGAAFARPAQDQVGRCGAVAAWLVVITGLALLVNDQTTAALRRLRKNARVSLPGAEWFRWPIGQTATHTALAANLRQCDGPVFTFHGQHSLATWSGKTPVNGFNCTHFTSLLRRDELDDTLAKFRAAPRWCAVIASGGGSFGRGPAFDEVNSFLQENTKPWLSIGAYEIRLAGQEPPPPASAVWKSGAQWMMNGPSPAVRAATKARLRADNHIVASFRWRGTEMPLPGPVPTDVAATLGNIRESGACLLMCNSRWEPLALLPLVRVESP